MFFPLFQSYDQGANFWVVECLQDERVWCEQRHPDGGYLVNSDNGNIVSSFVGFLIQLST